MSVVTRLGFMLRYGGARFSGPGPIRNQCPFH
jgi:hypothetical protein